MGCMSCKKVENSQVSDKAEDGVERLEVNYHCMFVIKEANENSEESAFPSRFQSSKNNKEL